MKVSDVMIRDVICARPEQTLRDAVIQMNAHNVRHLPVVERDTLVGIITERDVRLHTIPVDDRGTGEPHLLRLEDAVSSVMTRDPIIVSPDLDIRHVLDLFIEKKIGAVPVVTDRGAVVGILGYIDLLVFLRSII